MQPSSGNNSSILHAFVAIDELLNKRGMIDDIDKRELNHCISRLKPHEALAVYDFAISKMAPLKPDFTQMSMVQRCAKSYP